MSSKQGSYSSGNNSQEKWRKTPKDTLRFLDVLIFPVKEAKQR
jgi:hypothetical protein